MRFYNLGSLLAFLVTVALLIGALCCWIYEPASGKSPGQIAMSLLEYHNLTATNGLGDLGTELPDSLLLYHQQWNNCHHSGPDFAQAGYSYHRLGMYFERYFDLKRDLPDGHTWTLTCTVRAFFPIIGQRWWTQRLIAINDGTPSPARLGGQSNSLPDDAVISRSLSGTWHATVYAADNGWNEDIVIGTNGDYATTGFFCTIPQGGKEFGRLQILNGVLIMTATNQILDPQFPIATKLPYTVRQRIFQADARKILISFDPLDEKMLLEKQLK